LGAQINGVKFHILVTVILPFFLAHHLSYDSFSMDLKGQMLLGVWTKFFSLGDAIAVPHLY